VQWLDLAHPASSESRDSATRSTEARARSSSGYFTLRLGSTALPGTGYDWLTLLDPWDEVMGGSLGGGGSSEGCLSRGKLWWLVGIDVASRKSRRCSTSPRESAQRGNSGRENLRTYHAQLGTLGVSQRRAGGDCVGPASEALATLDCCSQESKHETPEIDAERTKKKNHIATLKQCKRRRG